MNFNNKAAILLNWHERINNRKWIFTAKGDTEMREILTQFINQLDSTLVIYPPYVDIITISNQVDELYQITDDIEYYSNHHVKKAIEELNLAIEDILNSHQSVKVDYEDNINEIENFIKLH